MKSRFYRWIRYWMGLERAIGRRVGRQRLTVEMLEDRVTPSVNWVGANADWSASVNNWLDSVNQTHHLPTLTDDVVIDNGATVSFNTTVAINTLNIASTSGLSVNGGTLTVDANSTWNGAVTIDGGTVNVGDAASDVTNTDNLALNAGTLAVTGTLHVTNAMNFTGGTLSGTGLVTVGGLLTWSNGSMNGTGRTSADGGIAFNVSGLDRMVGWHLDNAQTATWTGAGELTFQEDAVFTNNGTFDIQNDHTIFLGGGVATFNNNGILKKSAGSGTSTIGITFNNDENHIDHHGSVDAQTGTLRFNAGSTSTGTWSVAAPATLEFGAGTHNLNSGSTVTGVGTARFSGTANLAGTYSVTHTEIPGNVSFNAASTTTTLTLNGILGGTGDLTVAGLVTWNSGNMNGPGATIANGGLNLDVPSGIRLVGRRLDNAGLATWTGTGDLTFQEGAVFNNNGTFDIQNNQTIVNGGAVLNNTGTFKKSAGAGTTNWGVPFNNLGTVEVQSGALTFSGALTNLAGGTLTGGTWIVRSNATLNTPANVSTNQANVTLDGANSLFPSFDAISTNGASGVFTIQNGRNFNAAGTFNNAGLVNIGAGSTFTLTNGGTSMGDWDVAATGSLLFSGTNASYLLDDGTDITGAGLVAVKGNGTVNAGDAAADVVNISNLIIGPAFDQGNVNATGTLHVTGRMDVGSSISTGFLSGSGNVTVGGLLTLGHGAMSGSGTTSANGGMSLQIGGGGFTIKDGRQLDNNAPATWTSNAGQPLIFQNGAVFTNNSTFDIQVDAQMADGNLGGDLPNAINNTGTFKKSAGSGNGGETSILVPFNNNGGTVDLQAGTVTLRAGGTSTGPWTVASSATLSFFSGVCNLNAGSTVSGAGTVNFNGGTVNLGDTYSVANTAFIFSGTANFNANSSTTTLTKLTGTLGGVGDLTVNGLLGWFGGDIVGAGTVFAKGDITMSIGGNSTLSGRTLDLASNHTATWLNGSQAFFLSNGAVFNNHGTFDDQLDSTISNGGGATSMFVNNGTFKKSAGSGTTSVQVLFNNAGTIDEQTGTLSLTGGLTNFPAASSINIDSVNGATQAGTTVTITCSNGLTPILVGQMVTISGVTEAGYNGTFAVTAVPNATTFQYTAPTSGLPNSANGAASFLSTSTLTGGTYLISGTFQFTGANVVTNAANIVLNGPASAFLNRSTATDALANFATNAATGNFTIQNSRNFTTSGAFSNAGTVTTNVGSSFAVAAGNHYTQTGGTTTVNGSLRAAAVNINRGNYTQTSAGALDIEIAGTAAPDLDQFVIDGAATLGGTINVTRAGNFQPALNDAFEVLTFASVSGDFAVKNGYALGNALAFSEQFNPTNLKLVVGKAQLSYQVQPPAIAISGQPFQVKVLVSDANGVPLLTDNVDQVTLTLNQNSFHAGGTSVTQPVVNGVANFNLTIDQGAGGYALAAGGNGFVDVASSTFTVHQAPALTSTDHATFTVGSFGTFTVQTNGFPAPSLSIGTFTLPGGVTFTDNHDGTATLAGTPTGNVGGVFTFTITAHNGIGNDATQTFTLSVNQPASFTSTDHVTFTVGSFGSITVTTQGFPAPTLGIGAFTLPSGVTLTDNHDGTATLAGTPTGNVGGLYSFALTAHNGIGSDATQNFTLTVNQPAAITSANRATFKAGAINSFTFTTVGFPFATMSAAGAVLPAGVTFTNNGDGTATLAGTPTGVAGAYPFNVTVANVITQALTQVFTLTVTAPPRITSADHFAFTVGKFDTFTITASPGVPTATAFKLTGALPTGVTLTDNKNGTATLKGTPAAGKGGVYPISIIAGNAGPFSTTQSFTLTVNQAPSFSSTAAATFNLGVNNSFTINTKGFPAAAITPSVPFPADFTFHDNGNGTATLSGVPTVAGVTTVTLTASNGILPAVTQTFKLTVAQPPVITSSPTVTFRVGQSNSFNVTTTPGSPATTTLSVTGTLPAGLTFLDNKNGAGKLSGTPAAGTYHFTFVASNVVAKSTLPITLTVNQAPAFTSASSAAFTMGQTGAFTIKTKGFPTAALTHGPLPAGISFVDNGNGTATLNGAATSAGVFNINLTADNGILPAATQNFKLTIKQPPTFTSAANFTMVVGQASTFNFTTSPGSPATTTLTLTGTLPTGVTFIDNKNGSAKLTGKPAAGKGGVYHFTVTASNAAPAKSTQVFTLTVNQAPAITSAAATVFSLNQPGSFTIKTSGFPTAAITHGTLPAGINFTDNGNGTATLSGTPTVSGLFTFNINADNGVLPAATQAFKLTVNQPPVFTSGASATFQVNTAGSATITIDLAVSATTTFTRTGALPTGVVFTDKLNGTATLSGKPAAGTGGVYHLTITATNGASSRTKQSFTLNVNQAPTISSVNKATFTVAQSGAFTITTKGFPFAAIGLAGLPAGLTLTDNGNGTATVSGTPLAGTSGVYHLTLTALNSVANATQSFTLTVNQPPIVTSDPSTTFTRNVLNSFTFTASGVPAAKYTLIGTLPAGLTFISNANGTATLKGIPTAAGHFVFTISVTNGALPVASQFFDLTVT